MADVPKIMEEPTTEDTSTENEIDPIRKSEQELKKKYPGLNPKSKGVAQRKISTGGTQYFDSGEYAIQASRKDKQKIALNPKPFNPVLGRLQGKPAAPLHNKKPLPSGLATATNVSKVEQ